MIVMRYTLFIPHGEIRFPKHDEQKEKEVRNLMTISQSWFGELNERLD
jgi:hypothetical protein